MQPARLAGILSNLNRILRRKSVAIKENEVLAVSHNRADMIYKNINYAQKCVVDKISQDLRSSKEFSLDSVIAYSALRYFLTGNAWLFDSEDISILKKEIKKINALMNQKRYIKDINSIVKLMDEGLEAHNLIRINSGSSFLCNVVCENKMNIFAAGKFADWYDKADMKSESDKHKDFRKVLNVFHSLDY